jgi:hypothetical protein
MVFLSGPFKVKLRGRSGVEYTEGGRSAVLDSEMLAGDGGIVIYSSSLTSWRTSAGETPMSEEDRNRVKDNVSEGLERHRIPVRWS